MTEPRPVDWSEQDCCEDAVWEGLDDGNLEPLQRHLAAGLPVSAALGRQIALSIEVGNIAWQPDRVETRGRHEVLAWERRMAIGAHIAIRDVHTPRRQARLFEQAVERFASEGVTLRLAKTVLIEFRKDWADPANLIALAPIWSAAMREFCEEFGFDFRRAVFEPQLVREQDRDK